MIYLCVNPFSGSGQNLQRVEHLAQLLQTRYGLESQIIDHPAKRREILGDSSLMRSCRCIVVAGGDGSVASAINDLHPEAAARVPIAVMSLGNENLLARELNLFRISAEDLASAIAAGRTRPIDIGVANGRRFTLMVSAGMDADVVCRVEAWRQTPQGLRRARRLSYAKPIAGAIMGYHYHPLELHADGQCIEGTHALVFNINRYACGLSFAPQALCDDGLLDYLVFRKPGKFNAVRYMMLVAMGRHLSKEDVIHGRARHIRLHSTEPLYVQADGDTIGQTPVKISIDSERIHMIVP